MAIAAILQGQNLLLTGPKATGKNILAENLSYIFNRPSYNVSFHVNTNSGDLIGTDTFEDNEVKLRKGYVDTGDEDVDMYRLTEECVRVTEEFIKEHPDEWLWFQHRWMTKMDQIIDYDKKVAARERAHEKQ